MIKIGMLGMSPGNAHPYSWSAIINGQYDGAEITRIGYPGVTEYLNKNKSSLGIDGARVTHVWAQDRSISESIAGSSEIPHVVSDLNDMIGAVDAIILGRDDPENHVEMARPFIDADIPIFIDKPLAANRKDLQYFKEKIEEGKFIFSCSSMRYAAETQLARSIIDSLGPTQLVTATGKKDWIKYGVHMLEAVFAVLDDPAPVSVWSVGEKNKEVVHVEFENGIVATFHLFMDISSVFQVNLYGTHDYYNYQLSDSYAMFSHNLDVFVEGLRRGHSLLPFKKTYQIINTVISALESQESGQKINLKSL